MNWHQYLHLCNLYWLLDSSNLYKNDSSLWTCYPLHYYFLCTHFRQPVHCMELLLTPLPQTPHGHLAAFCISFWRSPLIRTLVLFIFTLIPYSLCYPSTHETRRNYNTLWTLIIKAGSGALYHVWKWIELIIIAPGLHGAWFSVTQHIVMPILEHQTEDSRQL